MADGSDPARTASSGDTAHGAELTDLFETPVACGRVLGSRSTSGMVRQGTDVERVMAVDGDALRMQPLIRSGWGREALAYGPFDRRAGLLLAMSVTNGHATSQDDHLGESMRIRFNRWFAGAEETSRRRRIWSWLFTRHHRWALRRIRHWLARAPWSYSGPPMDDNQALGWFPEKAPADPTATGHAFFVRAVEADNGELCLHAAGGGYPVFRRLGNVEVVYAIALRERGAMYFASGAPLTPSLAAYPEFRPLGIDPFDTAPVLYAGIQQAVLGQVGFRVDTRVRGVVVAASEELAIWCGPAVAADRLSGEGVSLADRPPERGGAWRIDSGMFTATASGAVSCAEETCLAWLACEEAIGLTHVLFDTEPASGSCGVAFGAEGRSSWLLVRVGADACRIERRDGEICDVIASGGGVSLRQDGSNSLQVLVGEEGGLRAILNGVVVVESAPGEAEAFLPDSAGPWTEAGTQACFRDFEIHSRTVRLPGIDMLPVPPLRLGERDVLLDEFDAVPGPLEGRACPGSDLGWKRLLGDGRIEIEPDVGARVMATKEAPNPGRLLHALDWTNPDFADVEIEATPPGDAPQQGEKSRAGVVFWQDEKNYLIFSCWLDDWHPGRSIALFPHLDGFGEIYDAVWVMVATDIQCGEPFRLRVAFDGMACSVLLNGKLVMSRRLTDIYPDQPPLKIRKVGLAVNWEWGNDTGSVFRSFRARD